MSTAMSICSRVTTSGGQRRTVALARSEHDQAVP